jgi:hypothetical protein
MLNYTLLNRHQHLAASNARAIARLGLNGPGATWVE